MNGGFSQNRGFNEKLPYIRHDYLNENELVREIILDYSKVAGFEPKEKIIRNISSGRHFWLNITSCKYYISLDHLTINYSSVQFYS